MDEDQLSPELGRLIDTVKAAARTAGSAGRVRGRRAPRRRRDYLSRRQRPRARMDDARGAGCSAAQDAVDAWRGAGGEEVLAAALAWADAPAEDALPCSSCRETLAAVDPDLPLVIKRRGRWVVVPLSGLPGSSAGDA